MRQILVNAIVCVLAGYGGAAGFFTPSLRAQQPQSYRTLASTELSKVSVEHLPHRLIFVPSNFQSSASYPNLKYTIAHMMTDHDRRSPFHYQYGKLRPLRVVEQDQNPTWWKMFEIIHQNQLTVAVIDNPLSYNPDLQRNVRNVSFLLREGQIDLNVQQSNGVLSSGLANQMRGDLVEYNSPQPVQGRLAIRYNSRPLGWRVARLATAPFRLTAALVDRYRNCCVPYEYADSNQVPTIIIAEEQQKFSFNSKVDINPTVTPPQTPPAIDPDQLYADVQPQPSPYFDPGPPDEVSPLNWWLVAFGILGVCALVGFGGGAIAGNSSYEKDDE